MRGKLPVEGSVPDPAAGLQTLNASLGDIFRELQRLSPGRQPILDQIDSDASDVRTNMDRLRELRLAKEAQEVRTEISIENQSTKAKRKKRFR